MKSDLDRTLLRLAFATLVLLYVVVLAGSVVRATGSGMGCPDWPRCFGQLIPPTDISQLPANYKEIYRVEGKEIADFNVVHTWTEYINRLCGAVSGLTMLATAVVAFLGRSRDRKLPWILFGALGVFGFVSWMGRVVVATNLEPFNITIHVAGALVLISASLLALVRVSRRTGRLPLVLLSPGTRRLVLAALVVCLAQILLGTQVREHVDEIRRATDHCCPERVVPALGSLLLAHKISAWLVVGLLIWTWLALRKTGEAAVPAYRRLLAAVPVLLALEYLAGAVLVEFALPPVIQPVHMFLAAVLFGVLTTLVLTTSAKSR